MIHESVDSEASGNASRISGRAKAMTVISRLTMNPTTEVTASVNQDDRGISGADAAKSFNAESFAEKSLKGARSLVD